MSLENLLKIGELEAHETNAEQVRRMLDSAERSITDAGQESIGLDRDQVLLLDTFRVKRNAVDYTGDDVDEASVDECIEAADRLLRHATQWLTNNEKAVRLHFSG